MNTRATGPLCPTCPPARLLKVLTRPTKAKFCQFLIAYRTLPKSRGSRLAGGQRVGWRADNPPIFLVIDCCTYSEEEIKDPTWALSR